MREVSGAQGPRVVGRRTSPGAGRVAYLNGESASHGLEPGITKQVIATIGHAWRLFRADRVPVR